MSTLKYKATGRYSMGYSDPRGMFGSGNGAIANIFDMIGTKEKEEAFRTADTHVLRDLWLFTFGDAPASHGALREHFESDDDIFWVGHELSRRNQIQQVTMSLPDRSEVFTGYALTKEE